MDRYTLALESGKAVMAGGILTGLSVIEKDKPVIDLALSYPMGRNPCPKDW